MSPSTSLPRRPQLLGLYHVVPLDDDRVVVANAGRCIELSGPGFGSRVGPLLEALDGTSTLDQLRAAFDDLVEPLVGGLYQRALLTDAARWEDEAGASLGGPEKATAWGLSAAASPHEVAARLADATVVVAGCGPVGGAVAVLLAKAGVGGLVVVDDRPSVDTGLSPVLPLSAAGRRRSAVVQHLCAGIADISALPGPPLPAAALDGADLVVVEVGTGGPETAFGAEECLEAGVAYLPYTQDALEAVVGPLVAPGGRPCHRCAHDRRVSNAPHPEQLLAYQQHRARRAPDPDAFLAAHCAIVAGVAATEALRGLAMPSAAATAVVVDLAEVAVSREAVLPVPGCPSCAP